MELVLKNMPVKSAIAVMTDIMVIPIAIIVNVIPRAPFKARTTVKSKQAPVTKIQGVKPIMEETTVDHVMPGCTMYLLQIYTVSLELKVESLESLWSSAPEKLTVMLCKLILCKK